MSRKRKRGLWFYVSLFCAFLIAVCIIGGGYYYISLNLWIHNTIPELEDYPYRLVIERERKQVDNQPTDPDVTEIDEVLVQEISRDKIVMNLSRSEIRFAPFRRKAYVKVYLETAVPEKPEEKRVRVKLLEILKRKKDKWYLLSTVNLLIQ